MYTVGRLGSYITRGVYTVSGPFHPFGGAVDIIVVQQKDGSFKSSPWYVRFGKFQGVLKSKEKVVTISVDGVEADFHMYLDNKGEAYFLREVDGEEEGDSGTYPSSSGEDTDGQLRDTRPIKSKSCNFDADQPDLVTQIDIGNGKIVARTSSRRSQILGLVFGRKSIKGDRNPLEEDGSGVGRADSLERAEIAADLLEMNWSTNLASSRYRKDKSSRSSAPNISGSEGVKGLPVSDERGEMDSPSHSKVINTLEHPVLREEVGRSSWVSIPNLESSEGDYGVEMLCLATKQIARTSSLDESALRENYDLNSQTVRMVVDVAGLGNADHDGNANFFIAETTSPDPDSSELDAHPSKKLDKEQLFKEDILSSGNDLSMEESGADRLEAFACGEPLESSSVGLDGSGGKPEETLFVSSAEGAEVCVHAKTLHETADLISEIKFVQDPRLLVASEPLDFAKFLADEKCANFFGDAQVRGSEGTSSNTFANEIVTEMHTHMVTVDEIDSVKEVKSCSIFTISGVNNSIDEIQDGENMRNEDKMSEHHSSRTVGDSQELRGYSSPMEEEQLLFGDLDDVNHLRVKCEDSILSEHVEEENHPSVTSKCNEAEIKSLSPNDESHSSSDRFVQDNAQNDIEDFREKSTIVSSHINIPSCKNIAGQNFGRMAESLPNMWSHTNSFAVDDPQHCIGHSLDANLESLKRAPLREDFLSCMKSEKENDDQVSQAQPTVEESQISEELKNGPANPADGNPSEGINASNGAWGVWPFSFRRSRSMKATQPAQNSTGSSDAENTLENSTSMVGEKNVPKPKVKRKKVRTISPTPEQLASLNLKEGKNTVVFTFSTSMLGPQKVDARIYLWKWNTRVVISDVDGTITKSDVLGQFMPLVGMDWSQTGVAHLFSAIKENGYQLLFLSARAISQAYHTRQFLFNLKQEGKGLPDGPVVISPDGLLPSLFREVIRRAPHEFKIACLEDIKAAFPKDHNPFYAGFGNRHTDEFSYLKVGIPKGKIFIINPKGEVVVNRRVDSKSYTSLHTLVHDMFPPMSSSEQEDFNSWNYWRLPPPPIDM